MTLTEPITLADGVEFTLGMEVILPLSDNSLEYRRIKTSAEEHRIESFVHDGRIYNTIGLIDGLATTDLSFFYSSPAAYFNARAARLRLEIAQRQEQLEHVEALAILGS